MRKYIAIIAFVLLSGCRYDSFDGVFKEEFAESSSFANIDISYLADNYFGTPVVIVEDLVIDGYVISTDRTGNFFRSFIIDDGTAAIEVSAGVYDLFNHYQLGRRVVIRAKGLALGKYNGIVQLGIGINAYSAYRVEEFGSYAILDKYVERDVRFREERPLVREISELTERECGRVVSIDDVILDSKMPVWWADGAGAFSTVGNVRFKDSMGASIVVTTSAYADFAQEAVPTGNVSLTGILMYGKFSASGSCFALKIRTLYDVH